MGIIFSGVMREIGLEAFSQQREPLLPIKLKEINKKRRTQAQISHFL